MASTSNALTVADFTAEPPAVTVAGSDAPVRVISPEALKTMGTRLATLFEMYRSDRRIAELRWLRNQRQYLGIYDPEIEAEMNVNRSKAYPKLTRVKCLTVLSHLMNLMFPGNERNWELRPAPDPDISPDDVKEAVQTAQARDKEMGLDAQPLTVRYAMDAVHQMMVDRADKLSCLIDDQLEELGGEQSYDYIALNREVIQSGIQYGMGLLRGPYAKKCSSVVWEMDEDEQLPMPKTKTIYRPIFEWLPVWDFYPDLSAKTFGGMDGYFVRKVMSRSQVKALGKRKDFFKEVIDNYLETHPVGNYIALEFEQELRVMGVKANVNEQKPDSQKFQVLVWHGKSDGTKLAECGATVAQDKMSDELEAEIWLIDGTVIKCDVNPWVQLGLEVKTLHHFLYDKDDTSPIGFGLPNAVRDSQMIVSAATRMLLDNASVVCGPNLELNTDLLRADQDLTSLRSYRMWYREGSDVTAQWPAVRNVQIDSHIKELMEIIQLGMKFADIETFVGPANGGDQSEMPSEPYRTAAGASMLRGNAALPFKDVVRSFDSFTQSVIQSLVCFNRKFNPEKVHEGDYNVIARGATSLIAKEVKGMQADQLTQTLTPEEKLHVDSRKLLTVRLKSRDMEDILVSDSEAQRRQQQQDQDTEKQQQQQDELAAANVRKLLTDSYKNIATGQKNLSAADAQTISAFMELLTKGLATNDLSQQPATTDFPTPPDTGAGVPALPGPGGQPGGAVGGGAAQPGA